MRTPLTFAEIIALPVSVDGLARVDVEVPADSILGMEDDDFMNMLSYRISEHAKYPAVYGYEVKGTSGENIIVTAHVEVTYLAALAA